MSGYKRYTIRVGKNNGNELYSEQFICSSCGPLHPNVSEYTAISINVDGSKLKGIFKAAASSST